MLLFLFINWFSKPSYLHALLTLRCMESVQQLTGMHSYSHRSCNASTCNCSSPAASQYGAGVLVSKCVVAQPMQTHNLCKDANAISPGKSF